MPHARIQAGGVDAYEHVVIPDDWLRNVPEFQNLGRAVGVVNDSLHFVPSFCVAEGAGLTGLLGHADRGLTVGA